MQVVILKYALNTVYNYKYTALDGHTSQGTLTILNERNGPHGLLLVVQTEDKKIKTFIKDRTVLTQTIPSLIKNTAILFDIKNFIEESFSTKKESPVEKEKFLAKIEQIPILKKPDSEIKSDFKNDIDQIKKGIKETDSFIEELKKEKAALEEIQNIADSTIRESLKREFASDKARLDALVEKVKREYEERQKALKALEQKQKQVLNKIAALRKWLSERKRNEELRKKLVEELLANKSNQSSTQPSTQPYDQDNKINSLLINGEIKIISNSEGEQKVNEAVQSSEEYTETKEEKEKRFKKYEEVRKKYNKIRVTSQGIEVVKRHILKNI